VLDADGNPILDENGRFVPGPVAAIPSMRKESGFREAYQIRRSGEWEFAVYRPDGTPQVKPQDSNFCAECHQDAGSTKDWVFRGELFFNDASGALPQPVPSLAEAGRVVLRSYLRHGRSNGEDWHDRYLGERRRTQSFGYRRGRQLRLGQNGVGSDLQPHLR